MRRGLMSCVVVAIAVVLQRTIVDRLSLPGGTEPDLVLVAVVALALTGGPLAGMLTGFFAGVAVDVAPPASHIVGVSALVFCLLGYACGTVAAQTDGSAVFYAGVAAAGAAVGEALRAALGVLLSDPAVTWQAVRQVLPPTVVYDVILSPFVLYVLVVVGRWVTGRPGRQALLAGGVAPAAGWLLDTAPAAGTLRQVAGTAAPRLRLADGRAGDGWVGGQHGFGANHGRGGANRAPRLRFDGQRTGLTGASNGARVGFGVGVANPPKVRFGSGRRGDGTLGRYTGNGTGAGRGGRLGGGASPKVRFGTGRGRDGAITGRTGNGTRGARLGGAPPKVRFGGRRWDGALGGGVGGSPLSGRGSRGRMPRFRPRRATGALGVGGTLRANSTRGSALRGRGGGFTSRGGAAPRFRPARSKVWRLFGRGKGRYR